MERTSRTGRWTVACMLIIAGCDGSLVPIDGGDEGTSTTDSALGSTSQAPISTSTSTTAPDAESSESGLELLCTPGTSRCAEDGTLETCDAEGLTWNAEACPQGMACVEGACLDPCDQGGPTSSQGCSFLVARQLGLSEVLGPALDIPAEEWPLDGLLLLNPSETTTANVDLYALDAGETDPGSPVQSLVLAPGAAELVPVGNPLPLGAISTIRVGSMTWVESDQPIVAYSFSPIDPFVGNDSSMLLPETALGQHYVIPSYPPHYLQFQGAGTPSYFDVLATSPNTTVRWRSDHTSTWTADVPNVQLPAGQWSDPYTVGRFAGLRVVPAFEGTVDPHDVEVSGTVVEASAPVYVIGGSRCSAVPEIDDSSRGCDPLTEALIPLEQWGSTYAVPAPPPRANEDYHYRIYAGDADITLSTDPPAITANDYTFVSRGDYVELTVPFGTQFSVSADGPIMVVGYLASRNLAGELGDPAMYQLVSFEQADTHYVLGSPGKWDSQYVQVVREVGRADVTLDGTPLADWQPVGGAYESTTILVEPGVHTLDSDTPFVATQFGYNNSIQNACEGYAMPALCHTSYAHPVGTRAQRLYEP